MFLRAVQIYSLFLFPPLLPCQQRMIGTMATLRNSQATKSLIIDVEKQVESQDSADSDKNPRFAAVQALFRFDPEQMRQIRALPSLTYWCHHLEECFQPLLTNQYAGIWITLGLPRPEVAAQCWDLFQAVSRAVAKLDDAGHSIEDVWELIKLSPGANAGQHTPTVPAGGRDDQCLMVIFAMLCWSSMILQPELTWNEAAVAPCLAIQQPPAEPPSLKIDFVQRPIPAVFRNFQKALARRRLIRKPTRDGGTTLFVSTINYHSLRTIGKVSLRWVDDLTCHLSFDSRTRTLSVFRLPSFCACTTIGSDRDILFEEYGFISIFSKSTY